MSSDNIYHYFSYIIDIFDAIEEGLSIPLKKWNRYIRLVNLISLGLPFIFYKITLFLYYVIRLLLSIVLLVSLFPIALYELVSEAIKREIKDLRNK